jgi:hypothetical protein
MRATCLNKRCQHRAGYLSQFTAGLRSLLFAFNMNSLSLSLEHLLRVYFRSECPPPWSPSFTQSILLRDITSALDDLASNSTVRGAAFQYIQAKCPLLASYQTVSGGTGRHTMRQWSVTNRWSNNIPGLLWTIWYRHSWSWKNWFPPMSSPCHPCHYNMPPS